jgi:hypothetical protein
MAMRRIAELIIVSIVALNLAGQFIASACATQVPKTQAECEQAGMHWKPEADKCKPTHPLSPFKKIIALIGLGCALVGLF